MSKAMKSSLIKGAALFPHTRLCRCALTAACIFVSATSTAFGSIITVSTDTTWRAIAPVGNQEGIPITSIGLAWEAANSGWNTSFTFDDTDAAGWTSPVSGSPSNVIWADSIGSTPSYYRKIFELVEIPINGLLDLGVDDDAIVYINGQLAISDTNGVATSSIGNDVSSFLSQGMNLIAVKAHDSFGFFQALAITLDIETVETSAVPEPGTVGLLALGLAGLICVGRKRGYC